MSMLHSKAVLGPLTLQNHLAMAPMTRSRATGNIPTPLMVEYYVQRATAGLIITEGTSPSPNGLGYPRIPGIFSPAQVEGWKRITDAVHAKGANMFVQLMHCGRIVHPLNLPTGAHILAPSAVAADGEMYTDAEGMKPHPAPRAMTEADIKTAIAEFAQAAKGTKRSETDRFGKTLYSSMAEADQRVLAGVDELAKTRNLPHAQIALAWLLQKDAVAAPIVGATKMEHLETAVGALGVQLSREEVTALEAPYVAHPIAGFS